jgi:hypothetical protein
MKSGLTAGFFYFLIVGTAGVSLGVLREMFLTPQFGRTIAIFMELPLMLLVAWYGCRLMVRWVKVPEEYVPRIAMGVVALAALLVMEQSLVFAMRILLQGGAAASPWTLGEYAGLAGQIAYGLFPLLVSEDSEPETA